MFGRFTDRAKKVMSLARHEAMKLNHEYIGTEHILLGLLQEGSTVAANVLKNMNIDLEKIRHEVERVVKTGPSKVTMGQLPFTPRAKKVLELSMEEASQLSHNYIGTEHLLLGLIRENEGIAANVMMNLGVKLEEVREEVLDFLSAASAMPGEKRGAATDQHGGGGDGRDALVLLPEGTRFDSLCRETIRPALQDAGVTEVSVEGLGPKAPTLKLLRQPAFLLVVMNGLDADAIYALGYRHGLRMLALGIVERSVQPASELVPPGLLAFDDTADGREQLRKDVAEIASLWLRSRGG